MIDDPPEARPIATRSRVVTNFDDGSGSQVVVTKIDLPFTNVLEITWKFFLASLLVGAFAGIMYAIIRAVCFGG